MTLSTITIWSTIIGLGIATYMIGSRFWACWAIGAHRAGRNACLRYLPMAMMPALAAPMVCVPSGAEAGDPLPAGMRRARHRGRRRHPQPSGGDGERPAAVLRSAGAGLLSVVIVAETTRVRRNASTCLATRGSNGKSGWAELSTIPSFAPGWIALSTETSPSLGSRSSSDI